MNFSEKLSAARKAKGLSQEELAEKIEVSRQAISKWENGIAQPETANILKLCEILEVSPNELFCYEEKASATEENKKPKPGKKFLIIMAIIMLFAVYLVWANENNIGTQRVKSIPFTIASYSHSLVREECSEDFLAVKIVFSPEKHKDGYSYSLSVFNDEFSPDSTTVWKSEAFFDPETKTCTATIFVPKVGESQVVAFVSNGRISGTNLFCWIKCFGENEYKLRLLGESYE
ncbi:MAG: helix-turn-helix transcriptional regulator [Oscillospiraceae bacterium]|nr:helix-turn-helix transcriptional regulator [Oscillospiraceae bacterium]